MVLEADGAGRRGFGGAAARRGGDLRFEDAASHTRASPRPLSFDTVHQVRPEPGIFRYRIEDGDACSSARTPRSEHRGR
ncbi:hypothetical protein F0344_05210 [Streptomyces finlayi]|uniref:Uncharacterized protein n=1 Tax=Streptomyces finlayi TaxID=67296 RepID=A0A7G7BFG8_9ACTN|nr:hypothetical protein [Streptomyces finlayi]QNE74083.1 hypothetical protein F0344_05210 [Streptomyces finlayi]